MSDLLDFLERRTDVVTSVIDEDELEVSLVGSYASEPMRMELYLLIRAWETGQLGRTVEILD